MLTQNKKELNVQETWLIQKVFENSTLIIFFHTDIENILFRVFNEILASKNMYKFHVEKTVISKKYILFFIILIFKYSIDYTSTFRYV